MEHAIRGTPGCKLLLDLGFASQRPLPPRVKSLRNVTFAPDFRGRSNKVSERDVQRHVANCPCLLCRFSSPWQAYSAPARSTICKGRYAVA